MPDSPARLAERLRTEGEKSLEFFANLPEQAWEVEIYTDGAVWKLHQIIAHYASSEAAFGLLIEAILEGGSGAAEDFDLNRFNRKEVSKLSGLAYPELLRRYQEYRRENIARVARMLPADLERQGRHPFMGVTTMEEIIKMIYRHNQIHQREVRQALAKQNLDKPAR